MFNNPTADAGRNVKPVTPEEVEREREARDGPAYRRAVEEVNDALKRGNRNIAAGLLGKTTSVQDRVAAAFKAAGWAVDFTSDQRKGDFYSFKSPRE